MKSLALKPKSGFEADYFSLESDIELMTTTPSKNIHEVLASFGTTDFLIKQSILPVVSWVEGDHCIRCIGTASLISCSGYVMTAAHVLMDPYDDDYGAERDGSQIEFAEKLNFGVFIPTSPAYGMRGLRYFPFEKLWFWGNWKDSPLFHEKARFEYLTDIAICKIAEMPYGAAHQPFGLSLNPFAPNEAAYSIGYAEMEDIPLDYSRGSMSIKEFNMELYVSVGEVERVYPQNHLRKDVRTPGPCFAFNAKIPGKMSGGPIFGARGAVIRGVVSGSWSGEQLAYGAMLGPAIHLPLNEPGTGDRTLRSLMEAGNDGIAQVQGSGL